MFVMYVGVGAYGEAPVFTEGAEYGLTGDVGAGPLISDGLFTDAYMLCAVDG